MEETRRKNPWLGLESYQEGEILYGRDDDIRDLTQSVLYDTDTLLYGKSGIGKSSILNAGVIPAVRRSGFVPVLVRLSHKEQHTYLHQIKDAISKTVTVKEVVACKNPDKETLYEYFHRHTFHSANGTRVKILIVFDQFEEIFTLQDNEQIKKEFFTELADLLNNVAPAYLQSAAVEQSETQEELDLSDAKAFEDLFASLDLGTARDVPDYVNDNEIHIVFTIREDFLSEFEYYTATIPSLKQNRYGLRPINEEQAAQIILRPMPGLIQEDVAKLIIEKVTGRSDFELDGIPEIEVDSAVLSLYLNRLYDAKEEEQITADLVEQKGGEIISDFYHDAISSISDSTVEYLEDMLLNGQNRRDNITVYDAINDGHATEEELDILCNKKKILRLFNYAGDLRIEFVHDILCPVVKSHKDERQRIRKEEEERIRQEEEKKRILQEEENKRLEIERKAQAEKSRMQAEALRFKRRNRNRFIILGSAAILLLAGTLWYWWYYSYERVSYYSDFERIYGWPSGVGKQLSSEERNSSPLYYKLTHKGHLSHNTDVEVLSSNGALPLYPHVKTLLVNDKDILDTKAKTYYDMLCKVKRIHFVGGESGKIDKEIAYDENDNILFVVNYFHLGNGKEAWSQFVTSTGQAMTVRDNGIDRIKLSWHEDDTGNDNANNGRIASLMYFDALGVCHPASDSICGYSYRFAGPDTTYCYTLDEYGRPKQAPYNVIMKRSNNDETEVAYGKVININDSVPADATGPEGYNRAVTKGSMTSLYVLGQQQPAATREIKYDKHGNKEEERTKGKQPVPYPSLIKYSYADHTGYMTKMEKYNADGKPFFTTSDSIYKKKWQYTQNGLLTLEEHWDINEKRSFLHRITRSKNVITDEMEDFHHHIFLTRIDSTLSDGKSTSYYGKDNQPIVHKTVEGEDTLTYHKVLTKNLKDSKITYYFTLDEKNNVIPCPKQLNDYGKAISFYCRKEGFDNNKNRIYYILLDVDSTIIKSMMRYYQNGQDLARAVMGVDGYGHPVRCPNWEEEGYAYYKLYYNKDFNNRYVSVKAVNEWETPSIFFDALSKQYQTISYKDYQGAKIEKNNEESLIMYSYKQFSLGMAHDITDIQLPYIHILDKKSELYVEGLRDGDRIIALGNWRRGMSTSLLDTEWKRMKSSEISITVLRPNNQSFETITKNLSRGSSDKEEYHIYALTTNELKQFNDYINK